MGWFDERMGTLLSKFGEGRGGGKLRCVVGGGREGTLFSFSAYLAALKGVMEAVRGGYIIIIIIIITGV